MPEGQFTGKRKAYLYESDGGTKYLIRTDETLGELAGNGLEVATTANAAGVGRPPIGFKPRVVFWQGELDGSVVRKELICGDVTADLYSPDAPQSLTVDEVEGSTTGKRGEKLSFLRLEQGGDGGGDGGGTTPPAG